MNYQEIISVCAPAKVLAVSKLQPAESIRLLYNQGQRIFGENYVQEALEKMESLQYLSEIQWHLVGHLQKNKIKSVVGRFFLIHSVDSLALAQALSRQCVSNKLEQNILIQVNLSKEDSKGGFDKYSLKESWKELTELRGLNICGLMTMPPLTERGEEVRPYFKELRELLADLRLQTTQERHTLQHLSMGTSNDFKVAVEEGSTIVRLGTILFGERPSRR